MKNKIYIIAQTESILTKRGNRHPNIADYLVNNGSTIIYYTSNFYHSEKRFFKETEILEAKKKVKYNLKVLKTLGYYNNIAPRRVINNFLFSLLVFIKLVFIVQKQDKVFLPSRPVELIFFMSLLKRIKGVRIYLDIQDIWPDALEIKNKFKKKIFEIYCNIFLKPSLKYYDNSLVVAPSFEKWLRRYAKHVPAVFVPLGWENDRWLDVDRKVPIDNSIVKIVCVAQLQHQIDIMPILEVLKDYKKYHLTIIGEDGKGDRYAEVIKYIEKNLISNVDIIGKVTRGEMKNHLEFMSIGILPMLTTSIPNKIFDYMACELPIIVLGENDSSHFVVQNEIGWSCDYNSNSLLMLLENITEVSISNKISKLKLIKCNYSRNHLHKEIKAALNI